MFCCLREVGCLEDLPEETLARFFELLAEGQVRREVWRLPAACLASMLRGDLDRLLLDAPEGKTRSRGDRQ